MSEPFGPFRDDIRDIERVAQLRCLRTLVRVFFPLAGLEQALRDAEADVDSGPAALSLFAAVPPLRRRQILATFASLHSPRYSPAACNRKKGTAHDQVA